jgi:hypothetical protein
VTRAIAILLALCATARADDSAQFHRLGKQAFKTSHYDAAALNYERAYELRPHPDLAYSAAMAHRLQYQVDHDPARLKRAVELFEIYVAQAPKREGSQHQFALVHLEQLRAERARLEAAGTKIVVVEKRTPALYVSVAIDGARIMVDGKPVERYTSIEVSPGEHVVEVSADGYVSEQRKVTVADGQAIVPVELRPQPATLSITSERGAHVVVDGRELAGTSVEPGKRTVTVYARGRKPVTQELELQPGKELKLAVPLVATARRKSVKWVAIGSGALAAASLVTGAIALAADLSAADLRDSAVPLSARDARRYEQLRDRRDAFRTTSLVLGGAAIAAAGTALWLYYAETPSTGPRLEPLVVSGGAGLLYTRSLP